MESCFIDELCCSTADISFKGGPNTKEDQRKGIGPPGRVRVGLKGGFKLAVKTFTMPWGGMMSFECKWNLRSATTLE